ncbi:glutamate receptor ionotropic, delta-1-like [Stegodyphus dumicola]|uniref:glutamate receptor ionotropic, delta-1-like n=1 Tax=Stegodyphus dumicola TaxID=202533 RepID=UPI0015A823A3|nr:glutamate receptor ionotropic, delta-1-like [Stegodyphus dumicola]
MLLKRIFRLAAFPSRHLYEGSLSSNGELKPTNGVEFQFLSLIAYCLSCNYTIVKPIDGEFGRKLENGTWTGIIGMIKRGEIDFAINMIALTAARREAVHYSYPYNIDGSTFITQAPSLLPKGLSFFYPFDRIVWLSVALALVIAPFVFIEIFRRRYRNSRFLLEVCGSFLGQPLNITTDNNSERIWYISWLFYTKIIGLSYCGVLLSFLTIPLISPSVRQVNQLAKAVSSGQYECYIFKGTSDQDAFYSATSGPIKIIGDHVKSKNNLVKHGGEISSYIPNSRTVLIGSKSIMQFNYLDEDIHKYFVSPDLFYITLIAIPVKENFCCLQKLNKCIHRITAAGLYKQILNFEIFKMHFKSNFKKNTVKEKFTLKLEDIYGAFILLGAGHIMAFTAFFFEIGFTRLKFRIC